jgi:hypothetical protein
MCGKPISHTASVCFVLALSMLVAIPARAQVVAPAPVPAASGGASLGVPAYVGIAVAAGAVSVISYAAYVSIKRHRELTRREAMTAVFLPFIGPAILEMATGGRGDWDPTGPIHPEDTAWSGVSDSLTGTNNIKGRRGRQDPAKSS